MSSIKRRTIHIDSISCAGCEETIRSELSKMDGIIEVQADHRGGAVSVVYDLLKIDLEKIEGKLEEIGYPVHAGFFGGMKDSYLHFTETNERDNINAPPMPCCTYPEKKR